MKYLIHNKFKDLQERIVFLIDHFLIEGKILVNGQRNAIKLFEVEGITLNIKSFKRPNLINKIVYRYFRKSKARRSFEFASKLMEMQIGTPQPVAFYESYDFVGLKKSYYACEHLANVFEFRVVERNKDYPDAENILRQFTRFTFEMHQKGIEFLDHSPGNTLIKKEENGMYSFYLVDLNRMNFHENIDFQARMKNFSRLTSKEEIVVIMSDEYAKLSGENAENVFQAMWKHTQEFQHKFYRKKQLKKKLKFWKK
mgnify:CR=1 FL=1